MAHRLIDIRPATRLEHRPSSILPETIPSVIPPPFRLHLKLPQIAFLHPISAGSLSGLIAILFLAFYPRPATTTAPISASLPAATPISMSSPGPTPQQQAPAPVVEHRTDRLKIPVLGIDATIKNVGLTASGDLDTPTNLRHVGWYERGPWPGRPGTAIIDGHSGAPGQKGVFKYLHRLKPGAQIIVTKANGESATFLVRTSAAYPATTDTAQKLFSPSAAPILHLVSCYGRYNPSDQTYDQRWLVIADPV